MTQLMLDFTSTITPLAPAVHVPAPRTAPVGVATRNTSPGSLAVYDAKQGKLHCIGDLAQAVLARYDIVHRRRAARLAREAAQR